MTQEEFIKELKRNGIPYEVQGERIIITYRGYVSLPSLEIIPPGVEFVNRGPVLLSFLEAIPPGVEFRNEGGVYLESLESIPPGVEFKNRGDVLLSSLEAIPPGVEFRNGGSVWLGSILGGWVHGWQGNIEGVHYKTLLNHLIKKGAFV